jgi:hypothetical protein
MESFMLIKKWSTLTIAYLSLRVCTAREISLSLQNWIWAAFSTKTRNNQGVLVAHSDVVLQQMQGNMHEKTALIEQYIAKLYKECKRMLNWKVDTINLFCHFERAG